MNITRFADCHPDRRHEARGLCHSCYNTWWDQNHPEIAKARSNKHRQEHPDRVRAASAAARLKSPEYAKEHYWNNLEYYREKNRLWKIANPGRCAATENLRRANKLQATPKWLTKEQRDKIVQIYINCPKGYHVDHIFPLKGRGSCGLHVPWNLQYLPASENLHKSNKHI
jgi:hypothetical protein